MGLGLAIEERSINREEFRYGYQGDFAEKDEETGWNSFELRMCDPVIGRWMATDPAGQYSTSYMGMGNNPVNRVDTDGGLDDSPIYGTDSKFLGVDSEGFSGDVIIMKETTYNALTGNGARILDHDFVTGLAEHGVFVNYLALSLMSLKARASIYTHLLKQMKDLDFSKLFNGSVSIYNNRSRNNIPQGFNSPDRVGRYRANPNQMKININSRSFDELSTVEIIQNYLGIHEWKGHNILKFNNGIDHYKAYDL